MFKKINLAVTSGLLAITSFGALAHSGHDHSDPTSGLIHLAWAAPVLIIGAYVSYRLRKNKLAKQHKNEES